jgi:hypothetical protein
MRRSILFEFEDLKWFPDRIRESMTDYLRYFLTVTDFYSPAIPLIREGLEKTGRSRIIDLCSGSGGAIEKVIQNLETRGGKPVSIVLTDRFPNVPAYKLLHTKTQGRISYADESIDATDVPAALEGFRTIFSGFHHFDHDTAVAAIGNAVERNEGIGIFDGGDRNLLTVLGIIVFHPIAFLLLTPFFRPLRLSRFLFTYLVPLIPFCTVWDGVVSIIRLYEPQELLDIAKAADRTGKYEWKAGKRRNRFFMNVSYLVGYPKSTL